MNRLAAATKGPKAPKKSGLKAPKSGAASADQESEDGDAAATADGGNKDEDDEEASKVTKWKAIQNNDHLPAPYQPLKRGPKLVLSSREENSVVYIEVESFGGGKTRGGGKTKPRNLGRMYFELRNDIVPVACANFLALITGHMGVGIDGIMYHLKNNRIHRIVKGVLFEAGDLADERGNCSRSIYNHGGLFKDENFVFRHTGAGCLSMCNRGPDTNGSLFQVGNGGED